VTAGEECDDGNTTPGDGCNGTCLCGVGSGEVGCQDQTCPNKGELTLYAGTGVTCANNGDCAVGECDTGLGRCTTVTELDTGWTGIAHDADINDEVIVTGQLVCPGPGPTCGECAVIGLLPDGDNCRCANDSRAICDEPFVADADNCGGAICNCYFGPPLPLSAGNTPACVVNRFANDISGTANIDSGQGEITANLRSVVFTGPLLWQPCPVCGGTCTAGNVGSGCAQDIDCDTTVGAFDGVCGNLDPTPNDGIRGGRCKLGDNDGQTCDVQASHTTFPAPQGGGYSLDCFPSSGSNVSGSGLTINLTQTTGSVSLGADVVCGFPPFVVEGCHCGLCTGNTQIACASNADCSVAGGTCERRADGDPQPEQCDVAGCLDAGGGEGECEATGPIDRFCDAVLRANGEGFIGCNNNGDCLGVNIGIAAGNCTLSKIRECFLDPITATGVEDANAPVGVATFCIPTTSNGAINSVAGLPGPGRVKNQAKSRLFCANNPNNLYVPNVGCP
jgi:hypothetical protein